MDEKYNHDTSEHSWIKRWEEMGIYRWDSSAPREHTFVVDTPPPTVSGSLHVGHIFSYTQTDVVVRFHRMQGKSIFYPIGWDDNGLATERRVQNYFNIRCEPHLHYDPQWQGERASDEKQPPRDVSRRNFIEACARLTTEDEAAFESLFRRMGHSYDWSLQYATIDEHCQRISQLSFLDLVNKGLLYHAESPTMWDITFRSAVAQAEVEDREMGGHYHDIVFGVEGGGEFAISTTRPELLPACIAVVAHPDDARYKSLFGKRAFTPLFHAPVPIEPALHADPEKGSGIMMVCTFGDLMDVNWWKQSKLPLKQIIGADGKMLSVQHGHGPFVSLKPDSADLHYRHLVGLNIKQAQRKIVELLSTEGSSVHSDSELRALQGDPKPITHAVKFYEKGDRPLEFIPTRQWFIRVLEHRDALLQQGRKVQWHPSYMLSRYEHWVEGLNQDWCISRQRYFGVPFPVWYPLDAEAQPRYDAPIYAPSDRLPIDPMSDCPAGFEEQQRGKPGGFTGDPDVMDTWATSALTPQIQSRWLIDAERHQKLFPMDMRPQAHDIIRTWAFVTIAKAWMHEQKIPWKHAAISGFIMDPDRKKMSKSKGNVVTPQALIEEHSADAVRYWAARARLGADTAFDESLFKIGRKITTKIFNAARFVLLQFERLNVQATRYSVSQICVELDLSMIAQLRTVIRESTQAFENFEYSSALQTTEDFFWGFCDHYLELIKVRAYREEPSPERESALATLSWSLKTLIRLFAPVVPFVCEEVWSQSFVGQGRDASVHTTAWPKVDEVTGVRVPSHDRAFAAAVEVIGKIRGAKTDAKRNLRWEVSALEVHGPAELLAALKSVEADVLSAGHVCQGGIQYIEATSPETGMFEVKVVLGEG